MSTPVQNKTKQKGKEKCLISRLLRDRNIRGKVDEIAETGASMFEVLSLTLEHHWLCPPVILES